MRLELLEQQEPRSLHLQRCKSFVKPSREHPFLIDDWTVAPSENVIHRRGERIRLEPKTMDVLCHLSQHSGEVVSSEQILRQCWPGSCSSDSVVYKNIAILRKVLGERDCGAKYIMTIPKRGYRLFAEVNVIAPDGPAPTDAEKESLERALRILDRLTLEQDRSSEDALPVDPPRRRRNDRRLLRISQLLMEYVTGSPKLEASD